MKRKLVILFVILGVVFSLFISCKNDLIETLAKVQAHLEISVKWDDDLLPDNDFKPDEFEYTLSWTPTEEGTRAKPQSFDYKENKLVLKLDPGTYEFELKATKDGETKAKGKAPITIAAGQKEKLEIPLTYYVFGEDSGITLDSDDITLSGKLTIDKDTTINVPKGKIIIIDKDAELDIQNGKTLTFDGDVGALGDLSVEGNLKVKGDLIVKGELETKDTITVEGDSTIATLNISDDTTFNGNLTITDSLTIEDGKTFTVEADLTLKEDTTIEGDLTVEGNLYAEEDLTVKGNTTVSEDLFVIGTASFGDDDNILKVSIEPGKTFDVGDINSSYNEIEVSGGGKLKSNSDTTLDKITLNNNSILEIDGVLQGDDDLEIEGNGQLIVDNLTGEKLTSNSTITLIGNVDLEEIELKSSKQLTIKGDIEVKKLSGKGTLKVEGKVNVDDLDVAKDVTLDISEGSLKSNSEIELKGTLKIDNDWWDDLDENGVIFTVGNNASIEEDGKELVWYTLYGAKAQYYKADDKIQLEFIKGSGTHRVTPSIGGVATTEPITRVGEGVIFDVNSNKGLKLGNRKFILEDGSITITSDDWWTDETAFNVENGEIVANVGAQVKDKNNELWLGGSESGKWKLSGGIQIRFEIIGGIGTTTVNSTGTLDDAQLEISVWNHTLGHNLVIENNAKVLVSKTFLMAAGEENGKINVKKGGVLEIGKNITLKTYYAKTLTIGGEVIINGDSTLDIKDSWFNWEDDNTGKVTLKSGGTFAVDGIDYFGPGEKPVSRSVFFKTKDVDILFEAAGATGSDNTPTKLYTVITTEGENTGSLEFESNNNVNLFSHDITLEDGVTLENKNTLTLSDNADGVNASKITIGSGATLDTERLMIKNEHKVIVLSDGKLKSNNFEFEDEGKIIKNVNGKLIWKTKNATVPGSTIFKIYNSANTVPNPPN